MPLALAQAGVPAALCHPELTGFWCIVWRCFLLKAASSPPLLSSWTCFRIVDTKTSSFAQDGIRAAFFYLAILNSPDFGVPFLGNGTSLLDAGASFRCGTPFVGTRRHRPSDQVGVQVVWFDGRRDKNCGRVGATLVVAHVPMLMDRHKTCPYRCKNWTNKQFNTTLQNITGILSDWMDTIIHRLEPILLRLWRKCANISLEK